MDRPRERRLLTGLGCPRFIRTTSHFLLLFGLGCSPGSYKARVSTGVPSNPKDPGPGDVSGVLPEKIQLKSEGLTPLPELQVKLEDGGDGWTPFLSEEQDIGVLQGNRPRWAPPKKDGEAEFSWEALESELAEATFRVSEANEWILEPETLFFRMTAPEDSGASTRLIKMELQTNTDTKHRLVTPSLIFREFGGGELQLVLKSATEDVLTAFSVPRLENAPTLEGVGLDGQNSLWVVYSDRITRVSYDAESNQLRIRSTRLTVPQELLETTFFWGTVELVKDELRFSQLAQVQDGQLQVMYGSRPSGKSGGSGEQPKPGGDPNETVPFTLTPEDVTYSQEFWDDSFQEVAEEFCAPCHSESSAFRWKSAHTFAGWSENEEFDIVAKINTNMPPSTSDQGAKITDEVKAVIRRFAELAKEE